MLPHLTRQAPWFAFLVHWRNMDDQLRLAGSKLLRRYSVSEEDFRAKMCSLPVLVIGEIQFGFSPLRGELVGIGRMPEEMVSARGVRAVVEAAELAAKRGATVIGLGALTGPVTGGGKKLLPHLPSGVTLTNGNAYTAAVVRNNVSDASEALGLDHRAKVAIVGCTGSVGVPACYLLAEAGFSLILVGRNVSRVQHLFGKLDGQAVFAGNILEVQQADIVVLLTSHPSAHLVPAMVKKGAIVIDCAQPANVSHTAYEQFRRIGVTVVEGAIVRIPKYNCTYDFGFSDARDTFACLAETYLYAREGIREHSVGRPTAEVANWLERVANRHGVTARPLELEPADC